MCDICLYKIFQNGFKTNYTNMEKVKYSGECEVDFCEKVDGGKKEKIKKIVIKNENLLYVKKVKAYHCDFCGKHEVEAFESKFSSTEKENGNNEMQICYECVKQLSKLLPK